MTTWVRRAIMVHNNKTNGKVYIMANVKYPEIEVQLTGQDGNAFVLLNCVTTALKDNGIGQEEREEFFNEATSGDYDHLLQTCGEWVNVY